MPDPELTPVATPRRPFESHLRCGDRKFVDELTELLNRYGLDAALDTPDFVLADCLVDVLQSFDKAQRRAARLRVSGTR